MFESRLERESRNETLPQVRVTADEKAAVQRLTEFLSERDGVKYSVSDVVRIALRKLYEEHQPAKKPAKPRQKK